MSKNNEILTPYCQPNLQAPLCSLNNWFYNTQFFILALENVKFKWVCEQVPSPFQNKDTL